MLEKFFGKKKSIQRGLVIAFILTIILVEIASLIGIFAFNNNGTLIKLIKTNLDSEENAKVIFEVGKNAVFIGVFNLLIIGNFIMKIISRKMVKPIQKLTDATKKVASGDFSIKLETQRDDEVGELTNNFNKMVTELGSLESLQKEFIDNVSHEIKTPISSIQGFTQLLRDNNLSVEERMEYLDVIEEESNRLLNLTTNMLKLSKLQNQNRITNKEQIDVSEQIRRTITLLEPKWREKEISFNICLEEKYFYGDEELIFQVWVNLLDNAIKFSKQHGEIDITLKEKEDTIEIKIKDNGIGMSEEKIKRIFTRFYQIDKSHSEKGSGLGLAIVKRIVELSDGKIDVESKKDVGTTITVNLPIEKENKKIVIE